MTRLCLLLLLPVLTVSSDWVHELENKFKDVESECGVDTVSCQEAALKLAVYMAKLQDLTLTYEKSTTAVLDYLSKHEAAVQSLQNIHSGENANDFRHHQLDQLHELHNMATDLLETIPSHEQQRWLSHLREPLT